MISFIIPAYNEEQVLGRTLSTLIASADAIGIEYEIIVADDASTDRTAAIAAEYGARLAPLDRRQIAAARNAGAAEAKGDYLVFVDADTLVPEPPLRSALRALDGGAVGGGAVIRLDSATPWYGKAFVVAMMLVYRLTRLASGAFLFCTREAFDATGGFDEELYAAEELEMSKALGRQGQFVLLRDRVITSGRKIRVYSTRELFSMTFEIILAGKKGLRDPNRSAMQVWYGERRRDPAAMAPDQIA